MIAPYKVSLTKVNLQCETNFDDNNSGLYILNAVIHKVYIRQFTYSKNREVNNRIVKS